STSAYTLVVSIETCPSHARIVLMSTPARNKCVAVVCLLCRREHSRHTKAMHLLQAGIPLITIKDFLGHADVKSTEVYVQIDVGMKRDALALAGSPTSTTPKAPRL